MFGCFKESDATFAMRTFAWIHVHVDYKSASAKEFGTYRKVEQRGLMRACAMLLIKMKNLDRIYFFQQVELKLC